MLQLVAAAVFLATNALLLYLIFRASRPKPPAVPNITPVPPGTGTLDPSHILGWEYDYIRNTATEAMQDRHTMVNFYLLVAGATATGVITVVGTQSLDNSIATLLLWLFCGVGWLYFLKLVRLRQAWGESVSAMCHIKAFCIEHANGIKPATFRQAFLWSSQSVPAPAKRWTVFFLSAMLIAYLDSVALVAGALLLEGQLPHFWVVVGLVVLGMIFFGLHMLFYQLFLSPGAGQEQRTVHGRGGSSSNAE